MPQRVDLQHIQRRFNDMMVRDDRMLFEVIDPDSINVYLVRGAHGCLNHRVRYVVDSVSSFFYSVRRTYYTECGPFFYERTATVVKPTEATFICMPCFDVCERAGIETFGLIPDTGCSATGGRRYRPRR